MSKLPKKSLQRHSSASSARSWLRKRANGRDRVTVDGQDVRMPIVLDVQAPLKDSSMAELELWGVEQVPSGFTDDLQYPSAVGSQVESTKPSAPSAKFGREPARLKTTMSFHNAPGPKYDASKTLGARGNSASAIGTPWGSMYSIEAANREASRHREIQYQSTSAFGKQASSALRSAPSVYVHGAPRSEREKQMLYGKDMMREKQGSIGPGPGGAFGLHTTLHSVPGVQRTPTGGNFSGPQHKEHPRLHLVNRLDSELAGPGRYRPCESTFGSQAVGGRVSAAASLFSSSHDTRKFGADTNVGGFSNYAGRNVRVPDPAAYLHTIAHTSSVRPQAQSHRRSAPQFSFGGSKGVEGNLVSRPASEMDGFAQLVGQHLGDTHFLSTRPRRVRKRQRVPRAPPRDSLEETRKFWAAASGKVVEATSRDRDLVHSRQLRAATAEQTVRVRTSKGASAAAALRHGFTQLPRRLHLHHTKRRFEWRPTRSENDWGNPLKQHKGRMGEGKAGEKGPQPRSRVAYGPATLRAIFAARQARYRAGAGAQDVGHAASIIAADG